MLRGDIVQRVWDIVRKVGKANDVDINKGYVSRDHVHVFVSYPRTSFIPAINGGVFFGIFIN